MKKLLLFATILTLGFSACVEDKPYEGPASISDVAYTPTTVTSNDDVTVTAKITDLNGVASAKVQYKIGDGNYTSVNMTADKNIYTGIIPQQANEAEVTFYVEAVNKAGITTKSQEKKYTVGAAAIDYTKLVLNELNSSGSDAEKYIELYNNSDVEIDLEGVTINKDEELTWTGKSGQKIAPQGYFVILGAKGSTPDGFNSGFSGKKSVLVELFAPDGSLLDTFKRGEKGTGWGNQTLTDVTKTSTPSFSRCPNGTGAWKLAEGTQESKNPDTGVDMPD